VNLSQNNFIADLFQWALVNVFNLKGWFFSKVDLAIVFIYWTIHFLFNADLNIPVSGKKGVNLYLTLAQHLAKHKEVCGIL